MPRKSPQLQVIPQQSTQSKLAVTDMREKPVEIFIDTTRAMSLTTAIILQT